MNEVMLENAGYFKEPPIIIEKKDAILAIDIYCYGCQRLVAYSYTI